ncbi:MAG: hypothetical protein R3305_04675, partial [Gammaproteobacteria bacterium]|nr:hypothetical protein [Gammaproteobacteria bacterium]
KLGGILVELAERDGLHHVVAGIGINVSAAPDAAALSGPKAQGRWPQGAIDLTRAASGAVDRTVLATAIAESLTELFASYAVTGFDPYRDEWLAAHVLNGQRVELESAAGHDAGTVCGIGRDGSLVIEDAAGDRRHWLSGDVTVRPG